MSCNRGNEADKQDWRELLGQMDSNSRLSSHSRNAEEHSTAVPRTDAQLLKVRFLEAANKLIRKAHRVNYSKQQEQEPQQDQHQQRDGDSSPGDSSSVGSSQEQHAALPVGQQVREQLAALMATVDHDSWGTTKQSPAEIAQHIADSNRRAGTGGGGGDSDDGVESDDEVLELSPVEERFSDQAAVTAELKEMDEIYEVLAKVSVSLALSSDTVLDNNKMRLVLAKREPWRFALHLVAFRSSKGNGMYGLISCTVMPLPERSLLLTAWQLSTPVAGALA